MICFLQNELINKKHSKVFCSSLYAQLLHFWPGVVVEEPDGPVGDDKEDGGEREDKVGHEVAQHQRPPLTKWEKMEGGFCSLFFNSEGSGRDVGIHLGR